MPNLTLMRADPALLPADQLAVRTQIFQEAKTLAENLRDVTKLAIIRGKLPLSGSTVADSVRAFGVPKSSATGGRA